MKWRFACSQNFAHVSLCDGNARGKADSLGTGLRFWERMSKVAGTTKKLAEKGQKGYSSSITAR
jgi:hypothetical protein